MEKLAAGLLLAWFVAGAQAVGYRTFTDTQGRAIQARLLDADASRGQICIERDDGKKVWVLPTAFSEGDQEYIRNWVSVHAMLSDQTLRISAEPVSVSFDGGENLRGNPNPIGNQTERWTKVHHKARYAVEFRNLGDTEIQALSLEYHCYVKMVARGTRDDKIWMVSENLSIGPVKAGERAELSTREIALREWMATQIETVRNSSGTEIIDRIRSKVSTHDERLEGLWIRITVPLSGGEALVRDVCFPDDLMAKVAWEEKTGDPFAGENATLDPNARAALPISTLEFLQQRGRPKDRNEFWAWMNRARGELVTAGTDPALQQQVSDGMETFYVAKFDTQGHAAWGVGGDFAKAEACGLALHWYETAVLTDEYHLVHFAEILASSAQAGLRNGEMAVKYAGIALDKDKKSDERIELLARAYACNSQFDLAVKTQEEAIARLMKSRKDEKVLAIYQGRLELYRKGVPYTDKPKQLK